MHGAVYNVLIFIFVLHGTSTAYIVKFGTIENLVERKAIAKLHGEEKTLYDEESKDIDAQN